MDLLAPLSADEWSVIALSLRIAAVATLAATPVAIALAVILVRGRFPGRALLEAAVHLPLVLPPVVTGYLLLLAFGRQGPIGRLLAEHLGVVLAFRWTGAALAAAIMGLPFLVRAVRLSLEAVEPRLEAAAATLGAAPVTRFALVTLPLVLPGVLAGMVLCFAKALGEFGATITFVSNIPGETRTIPTAIYTATQVPGAETQALRLVLLAIGVAVAALLGSEWLAQRLRRRLMPAAPQGPGAAR